MGFKMFCEFTIGFAFGSFLCIYLNVIMKGAPEIIRMLKSLRLPVSFR
ncbi:MAG: hypothetical protein Q8878_02265 [Bacillota bacterium]|nr:hypothetical protein [Bacillota bacterium]